MMMMMMLTLMMLLLRMMLKTLKLQPRTTMTSVASDEPLVENVEAVARGA